MVGRPGEWAVHAALVPDGFECVAENHVIAIEFFNGFKPSAETRDRLVAELARHLRPSGSPNIGLRAVRHCLSAISDQ